MPLPSTMRPSHASIPQAPSGQPLRLLVVEDDLLTVFAMREYFAHSGYDVDCASTLADALARLDEREYNAIITDLHLTADRRGEGMKVAWHARRRHPQACIVMLTGYGTDTTEEEAQRCGVDMYQTKPVQLPLLSEFVTLALNGTRDTGCARGLESRWQQH